MNLRSKAKDTLDDVSGASKAVVETTELATVALVAVAALSVLALGCGLVALHRINNLSKVGGLHA